jgi:hypothetical protein
MILNIRSAADRTALEVHGFTWVTIQPRGDAKGTVASKHRSYAAADKAARGKELMIVEVAEAHSI